MLQQLYVENIEDYKSKYYPEGGLISNIIDKKEYKRLKIRFLSRATSYIITACNIEGIFGRSYLLFKQILRDEKLHFELKKIDNEYIKLKKSHLADIYFYRNKVLAHASFGDPRKDHATLQFNSLTYFSGNIMGLSSNGFSLGSGGWVFEGKEPTAPGFNLDEYHSFLMKHIESWCEKFVWYFESIETEDIKAAFDKIVLADKI